MKNQLIESIEERLKCILNNFIDILVHYQNCKIISTLFKLFRNCEHVKDKMSFRYIIWNVSVKLVQNRYSSFHL